MWWSLLDHFCCGHFWITFGSLLSGQENTPLTFCFFSFFGGKRTGWHTVLPFCCKIVCLSAATNTKPTSAAVAVPFWRHMPRNRMKLVVRVQCLLFLLCLFSKTNTRVKTLYLLSGRTSNILQTHSLQTFCLCAYFWL